MNNIIRPNGINERNIVNKINVNDFTYETKHDIANVLNSYFGNICKQISESLNAGWPAYDLYQYL